MRSCVYKGVRDIDYSKLHWVGDFMYSEIIGEPYEIENDYVVGIYSIKDFPEISVYIDTEKGKILDVWLDDDE